MSAMKFAGVSTTDNYSTGFVPALVGNMQALSQWLDPSYVTYTDTPTTGAKRISSGIIQQYNGSAWVALATGYVLKAGDTGLSGAMIWTSGIGAPTFTTRSAGAKLVLTPEVDATHTDYAIGLESSAMWLGVSNTTASFKWYGGATLACTLSGAGVLNAVGGLQVNGSAVWHAGNLNPSNYAALVSPNFSGTPTVGGSAIITAATLNLSAYALLVSPALTGVPTAPTAAPGTNTTQLATTAFVQAAQRGRYDSGWVTGLPAAGSSATLTHGLGSAPMQAWIVAECITTDGEYQVGDRVHPSAYGSSYSMARPLYWTASSIVVQTMGGGWAAPYRTTMGAAFAAALTPANWKYRVIAEL